MNKNDIENKKEKLNIITSYIKDLSVELFNPLALINKEVAKNIEINIAPLNIKHRKIENNIYEVLADCKISATSEDKNIFHIELSYGGLFAINTEEENLIKTIYIEAANFLYPYIRSQISNIASSIGINPLYLPFIDFNKQFNEKDLEEKIIKN